MRVCVSGLQTRIELSVSGRDLECWVTETEEDKYIVPPLMAHFNQGISWGYVGISTENIFARTQETGVLGEVELFHGV